MNSNTSIVILAAGKGMRMKSETPKVLLKLSGKPMITYLLESVKQITNAQPIIVVSNDNNKQIHDETIQYNPLFVTQINQLGTGDAVKTIFENKLDLLENILILYGDHPLISSHTIEKMINHHTKMNFQFTMLTVTVPHFEANYKNFFMDGRIIRNKNRDVEKVVEPNEATPEIMEMKEINPAIFLLNTNWLKTNIDKIKINKEKNEYYLTKLIEIAQGEKITIHTVEGNIDECWGANTSDQFENISNILQTR